MSTMVEKKELIAFHGKASIKKKYLARVKAHRKADEIIKGKYWESGKGCAVGCTIHGSNHGAYETELGIPAWLAYLEDDLFEKMPNADALEWPENFLAAVKVGADEKYFEKVRTSFIHWLLVDEKDGVVVVAQKEKIKTAIRGVGAYFEVLARGEVPSQEITAQAERAARDAWDAWSARAAWDTWSARSAWAAWDARSARDAWDARSARDAWDTWSARDTWSAWDARSARAARDVSIAKTALKQAHKLLELLSTINPG